MDSPHPDSLNLGSAPVTSTLHQGCWVMLTAIALGAFAAHGLAAHTTEQGLQTFRTGVNYQIYHGLALLLLGTLEQLLGPRLPIRIIKIFFFFGIIFFCLNCYLYALTQWKWVGIIIPVGGISFLAGWLALGLTLYRLRRPPHGGGKSTGELPS